MLLSGDTIIEESRIDCHGYSLGADFWIDDPVSILRNPGYFKHIEQDTPLRPGDIVAFTEDDVLVHSAVVTEPHS